ncbi:VWA domain-containing protein [uncultured Eubacterium sp.]|uniref:InlB B-repeat-containing protein n=1 Tax=uncultured Eubacterium sp. TaxID=165185 RepID=UPI0026DD797F|nr:VWA domain-containing protein [uncultured Eubacterium sp.]
MKSRLLKGISCLLACVMLLEATLLYFTKDVYSNENVIALKKEAVKWIEDSQNEDGSWGKSLGIYNTAEVLKYTGKQNLSGDVREKAVKYLDTAYENNNDDLYRKNSINEITTEDKIKEIIKIQNNDGSFSVSDEYKGDTFDTLLALEAMLSSELMNKKSMEKAVLFVLSNQKEDGSFSYTGKKDGGVYITAYAAFILKKYISENGGKESEKLALNRANEYLISKESEIIGNDEESLMNLLMITIALTEIDANRTLQRIEKAGKEIKQDGSLNQDECLTAMFVYAIDEYLTFVRDESVISGPQITGIAINSDENINAYTDIKVVPEIIGINDEKHKVSVCMGNASTAYVKGTETDDGYVINTKNMKPGEYYIVTMVTDKESGQVLAIKRKQVEISEGIKIFKSVLNYSPKAVSVNTKKEIKFKLKAEMGTNTDTDIDININVENQNGENVYKDNRNIDADANTKYIECNDFSFMSQADTDDLYTVTVRYKNKNTVIKTDRALIKVFDEENENRIDIKYEADKDEITDDDKYVNVKFDMQGIGLSENIKRRPMDIVIILDNSGSMRTEDWNISEEGAKIIVNYMQPEDRALIRYVNRGNAETGFSNDKEYLNEVLSRGVWLWGGTPIYSSINNSINDLKNSEYRDKVIYLFSDGERWGDSPEINVKELKDLNITIYSVFLEANASEESRVEAKKTMQYIADISDGVALSAPTNDEIAECVAKLANDIFMVAGKNIELKMKLNKDINPDDIEFSNAPDEIIKNDDGTNTLLFKQGYLSVGQDNNMEMKVPVTGIADDEIINLMDEITLSYTNENDEKVELKLDPLTVKRKITTEIVETEPETKQSTEEAVDKKGIYAKNVIPKESDEQGKAIKGNVSVDNTDMETGDTAKISYVIENKGQEKENGILKISAINIKNKNVTELENKEVEIGQGDKITEIIDTDTSLLGEGNFLIIYQFVTDDEVILMDEAGFKLTDHAYNFKIQCTDGGSIISETNDAYKEGQSISLEAVADEGYIFAGWECDYGAFSDRYDKSTMFTMPGNDVTVKAIFAKKKNMENHDNSISEYVTKDNSGEKPGNEITTQKAVKKDGNSNVKGRSEKSEKNSATTKGKHEKNANISGKHKKGYGKNDSIKKNSDGIKTYNVDENNQNNKEIKSGSPVKTGDFETRKTIAALMIIQFISIIVIIFMAGKKEKEEQ